MTLLPDTLNSLLRSGASVRIDARKTSISQLVEMANKATDGGGRLIIHNADSLTSDQARTLVGIAGKAIEFDLL